MKKILSTIDVIFVIFISLLFVLQILVTLEIVNFGDDVIFQDLHVLIYNSLVYVIFIIYSLVCLLISFFTKIKFFNKEKVIFFLITTLIMIISFTINL